MIQLLLFSHSFLVRLERSASQALIEELLCENPTQMVPNVSVDFSLALLFERQTLLHTPRPVLSVCRKEVVSCPLKSPILGVIHKKSGNFFGVVSSKSSDNSPRVSPPIFSKLILSMRHNKKCRCWKTDIFQDDFSGFPKILFFKAMELEKHEHMDHILSLPAKNSPPFPLLRRREKNRNLKFEAGWGSLGKRCAPLTNLGSVPQ